MKALLAILILSGSLAWATGTLATAQDCAALDHLGDFSAIEKSIARDMAEIKTLIQTQPAAKVKDRVTALAAQIKAGNDLLMKLIDPRFTDVIYQQELDWSVDLKELEGEPTLNPYLRIKTAHLTDVYNFSTGQKEALSSATLNFDSAHMHVHLERPASLLEICQLPEALMVSTQLTVDTLFSNGVAISYSTFTKDSL
jgi:hypothetical protein